MRPIFSLGYLRNRGNLEVLLPWFTIITKGKTLLFVFFSIFCFKPVLQNHILAIYETSTLLQNHTLVISETYTLYLLPISQT